MRERKKAATRVALRRAAVSLVAKHGLAAVTVEEIAAQADVSARTFFNYFTSKEDAVSGLDPELVSAMVEQLRSRPGSESSVAALRCVLLEAMAPVGADSQDFRLRMRLTWSDPQLLAHYASCWAERERRLIGALAQRRGVEPEADRYSALVVAAGLAALRVALMSWCRGDGATTLADELAMQLDLLESGLLDPTLKATSQ